MHGNAKEQAEIDSEKEIIEISTVQAMGKNKYGNVTQNELEEKLNSNAGEGKTEVIDNGDTLVVKFIDSSRYYEVDGDGNVKNIEVKVDQNPGNIKIGINGEELKGTEDSPFEIWCIEDLVEWSQNYAEYKNSYIKLGRTLNFNSNLSYCDGKILNCSSIDELKDLLTDSTGSGFTPIYEFAGEFDGQNFEIQNIYINTENDAGLIRWLTGEFKICNITMSGKIISKEGCAGGIVSVRNTGTGTIENCKNMCDVSGYLSTGGIIGSHNIYSGNLNILNSYNGGNISSETKECGGIIGSSGSDCMINRCINNGKITAKSSSSGGIIGSANSLFNQITIMNCGNYNNVLGGTAGGILAFSSKNTNVYNCFNQGNITCDGVDLNYSYSGGIVGFSNSSNLGIANNYNIGTITSSKKKGEIVGNAYTPIYSCYYLDSCIDKTNSTETISYTKEELSSASFVEKLNNYIESNSDDIDTNYWNHWKSGENGYPIFE